MTEWPEIWRGEMEVWKERIDRAWQAKQDHYHDGQRAHGAVSQAIKEGRLPPISERACQDCGDQAIHYHHENGYDEAHRLDVIPVCRECHTRRDVALRLRRKAEARSS